MFSVVVSSNSFAHHFEIMINSQPREKHHRVDLFISSQLYGHFFIIHLSGIAIIVISATTKNSSVKIPQ